MGGLIVGIFAGRTIVDIVFSRAIVLALVWALIAWGAASAAIGLVHEPIAGYVGGGCAIVATTLFATTPPFGRLRLALLEGLMVWCGLVEIAAALRLIFHVMGMGLLPGLLHELRWVGFAIVAAAVAGYAGWRFERGSAATASDGE